MSHRYRLSRQADADLEGIAITIGSENPTAAIGVLERLHETFRLLATYPEMGVVREDLIPNIRMFVPQKPAANYIIFYYPLADGVEISDVIHGARDWIGLFARGERGPE